MVGVLADWVDTSQGVANYVQALAILVGGVWAYFKFARGRTFAYRAEVDIAAALVSAGSTPTVKVTITLRNTGAAKIDLDQDYSVLYLYAAEAADVEAPLNIDWGDHVTVTSLFGDHDWIEAQETIAEEVLIPVRADVAPAAYKVVAKVVATRSRWRRELKWTANAVIPAVDPSTESISNDEEE